MKITIESTDKLIELQVQGRGVVPARVWEGTTDKGTPVFCFVTRIAPTIPERELSPAVLEEFQKDLREQRQPSPAVRAFDMRYVL
jgi:hypothetical protein